MKKSILVATALFATAAVPAVAQADGKPCIVMVNGILVNMGNMTYIAASRENHIPNSVLIYFLTDRTPLAFQGSRNTDEDVKAIFQKIQKECK
jgi:hypothetical protein